MRLSKRGTLPTQKDRRVLSTSDGSDPVAAGNGVALCAGCHSTGKDFVLSKYP